MPLALILPRGINDTVCVCVFVFFPFIPDARLVDVPAGVTQEQGHTEFLVHLPSAVLALIFLASRIQPLLSLVDREVEFCVLTIKSFSTCWSLVYIIIIIIIIVRKNPSYPCSWLRVRGVQCLPQCSKESSNKFIKGHITERKEEKERSKRESIYLQEFDVMHLPLIVRHLPLIVRPDTSASCST